MAKARKSMLEMDRGDGSRPGVSVATTTPIGEFREREADKQGLAELDRLTEASGRLTRAQKDRERIYPRAAPQPLNQATATRIPEFDEVRVPVSGRQMKVRSKVARATQRKWTAAQDRELADLMATNSPTWQPLTDQLAAHVGDLDALSTRDRSSVQRVDRTIRQYEEQNDRQHHVYANVRLPAGFDVSSMVEDVVHLDRWTAGSHNLHEISGGEADDSLHVLEITTRRGMYLGHSDGGSSAGHLLPRAMSFRLVKVYESRWKDAAGRTGSRMVLRLEEIDGGEAS